MTPSARGYTLSHPWISYRAELEKAPPRFWMLLGEARSKVEHIAGSPLKPEVATAMHFLYLAKGVHATTAIEGNSLSEEQARLIIENKLELPRSQEYLAREVKNIETACNSILRDLQQGKAGDPSVHGILEFNRQVLEGLNVDPDTHPGHTRQHSVVVARYRGAPAEDCDYLLDRLCQWLGGSDFLAPTVEMKLPYAILKAALAHLYIAWIHPFGDGNGRTARLLEFQILLAAGVPSPAAHLLSNHYNLTRSEYYRQLDQASHSGGDVLPFLEYAIQGFVDGLRDQLQHIRKQQYDDRWEQFVYETFGNATSPAERRRRLLVLELSKVDVPVPESKLRFLTAEVASAYGGKGSKTVARDLNEIVRLGLVEVTPSGYRSRKERILAFLPFKKDG